MAYSKIKPIRTRLDRCVDYVIDPEKTALSVAMNYIENCDKTEQCLYVSTYNCGRETAVADMMATKRRWNKQQRNKAVLGYHLIVSYAPGEVKAEEAHVYGQQLVQRLFADQYEVVLTTHTDKEHLHNHIVFNSVSFLDGKMYRNNFKDYFGDIRSVSDAICREYGLSVIVPKEKGKHYAEWQAEQSGKTTIRKKKTGRRKVSPYLYDDVIRFEKYVKQNKFLSENRIDTTEDIEKLMSFFHGKILQLVEERKRIGKEVRLRGENVKGDAAYQQCSEQIKAYRAKLRMCENILETEGRIRINLQTMKELERKEGKEHEPGKRSGRTNDKGNPANQRNHSETVGNRG